MSEVLLYLPVCGPAQLVIDSSDTLLGAVLKPGCDASCQDHINAAGVKWP